MSAPIDAPLIALDMAESAAAFAASAAAFAAGAAGVPAAAVAAASATCIAVSATCLAACRAATAASGMPRQAGKKPIITFVLPGPTVNTGGKGCTTLSVVLAAGPCGINSISGNLHCFQIIFSLMTSSDFLKLVQTHQDAYLLLRR
jgi:hypothetical protein